MSFVNTFVVTSLQVVFLFLSSSVVIGENVNAPSNAFYDPKVIQDIRIEIEDADLSRMKAALPERIYVPATFRWNDVLMENVAIRYKGNSSSQPNQPFKRSFLIKFDEWEDGQRFLGLRRVALDNGIQFGSLFSEPIVTSILREEGVVAPRCNHATLHINGEFMGVYVNVERIDRTFIARSFPKPEGALYKVDMGGPGCDLNYIGDEPGHYGNTFEPKSDAATKEMRDVIEFIKTINRTPKDEFANTLESLMDVDAFLKTTTVMLFAGAFDQLTGWNPHNYYLYHDVENDRRWQYLPWDLDVGFADNAFRRIPVIDQWHAAWPIPGDAHRPLLERIIADPVLLDRYRKHADRILEEYFKPSKLNPQFDALYSSIKEQLAGDPFPHKRITNPGDKGYESIVESIQAFVERRYQAARAQLDQPGLRPKWKPTPQERRESSPGGSTEGVPSKLRIVSQTKNSVTLGWVDNAKGEAGHVVQWSMTGNPDDFRNRVGRPGSNETSATVDDLQSGTTHYLRVYAVRSTPRGPVGTAPSAVMEVTFSGQ